MGSTAAWWDRSEKSSNASGDSLRPRLAMRLTPVATRPCRALTSRVIAALKWELYSPMFRNFLYLSLSLLRFDIDWSCASSCKSARRS